MPTQIETLKLMFPDKVFLTDELLEQQFGSRDSWDKNIGEGGESIVFGSRNGEFVIKMSNLSLLESDGSDDEEYHSESTEDTRSEEDTVESESSRRFERLKLELTMATADTLTTTLYVSPSFTVEKRKQCDLRRYIETHKDSPPSLKDRLNMCWDIYNGLKRIHIYNFAHLDIKPENIFVSNRSLSIGDFGFLIRCTNDSKIAIGRSPGWAPHKKYSGKLCQLADLYSAALVTIGILAWHEDIINKCGDFSRAFNNIDSEEKLCKFLYGIFDNTVSYNRDLFPETIYDTIDDTLLDKLKRSIIGLECGYSKRVTASIAESTIEQVKLKLN